MPRMHRRRLLALATGAAAAACAGCAAAPPAIDREARALEVADGVWMLPGSGGEPDAHNLGRVANAGFLVGPQGVLAVDAGTSWLHGRALLRAIGRHARPPLRAVLVTQTKPGALFGAPAFRAAGVPILMHRRAASLMAARCQVCLRNLRRDLGEAAMAGTAMFEPDSLFDDGHLLALTGRPVRVLYPGPSSGPGDVAVLDTASGVLLAGGLVESRRIPDLHDADLPGWLAALAGLQALADRLAGAAGRIGGLVPGHGAWRADGAAAIAETAGYLHALQAQVQALVEEGVPLSELPARSALPAYEAWDGYPRQHRRNAGMLFLRFEQDLLQQAQRAATGRYSRSE